ncbi:MULTISPECIES: hypothetical protein [Paenibacillus]|uniref:Uncharacterized protein n=1 Tax=Paenibacillus validus TaxID=44253 RepID=A0A7X2ZDH6_9BACL|nr:MULTISPECIES: hypothetical protein [Paenibacillus]MUG72844.1 hypothetical protein [Paenibacillus validus]
MSIHLAIALWTVFAAWRWGRWIQFSQCYPTMVYLACFQLLYEFFSHEKFYLWRLEPDPVFNYTSVVMLHTFCIYPLTAFLYLTRFPEVEWKAAVHIAKWVLIYIGVEWVGYRLGYITYSRGWNCWWSLFFDVHMFLMLRFHHTKPVWSIPVTVLSIFFYLIMFGYL